MGENKGWHKGGHSKETCDFLCLLSKKVTMPDLQQIRNSIHNVRVREEFQRDDPSSQNNRERTPANQYKGQLPTRKWVKDVNSQFSQNAPTFTATSCLDHSLALRSPPSPPPSPFSTHSLRDPMRTKSGPVHPLLKAFPWRPPHPEQIKTPQGPTRPHIIWAHHPSNLTPLVSPLHAPLQSHWPPHCSSDTLLPQGLCTGCSLCLEDSLPRSLYGPFLTSWRSLYKCHFLCPSLRDLTNSHSLIYIYIYIFSP